jgi:hypothetical protein
MSDANQCLAQQLLANDGLSDVELVGAVQANLVASLQRLRGSYTQSIEVRPNRTEIRERKEKREKNKTDFFFFLHSR